MHAAAQSNIFARLIAFRSVSRRFQPSRCQLSSQRSSRSLLAARSCLFFSMRRRSVKALLSGSVRPVNAPSITATSSKQGCSRVWYRRSCASTSRWLLASTSVSRTAGGTKNRAGRRAGGCPAVAPWVLRARGPGSGVPDARAGPAGPATGGRSRTPRPPRRRPVREKQRSQSSTRLPPSLRRPCAPRIRAAPLIFREAQSFDWPFTGVSGSETWRIRCVARQRRRRPRS